MDSVQLSIFSGCVAGLEINCQPVAELHVSHWNQVRVFSESGVCSTGSKRTDSIQSDFS